MRNAIPRRRFLQTAGAAVGASLAAPRSSAGLSPAISTPEAGTRPRLFVGCCAYSYRKPLEAKQMTMEDFILKAVELGLHGVDMTAYYFKSFEPDYLTSLRHLAFKNGMAFSGAAMSNNMCQPDRSKRAQEVEKVKQGVDAAEWLGASHLRVFGGKTPEGTTEEEAISWVVEALKPAADYAARKGITLGIENHSGITVKAPVVLEIVRRVDSPYAGINLDISNFLEDEYTHIEQCIPYATHAHVWDRFNNKTHRPIDLDRVWQIFARGGYKGYMSLEYKGNDPAPDVPKLVEQIKALCKKYSTA